MSRLTVFLLTACTVAVAQTGAQTAAPPRHAAVPAPAPVPSYKDLKFPPLKPIPIPPVESYTLPNGMRVYLLEDHDLPLVHGSARVRTGNLFDPPDKIGLAAMTGTVLRTGGTKSRSSEQIDEALENMAASVESSIDETSGSVTFSALKENTDAVLAIFHDVLTAPEFVQAKVDLERTQMRSSIARRNDDAHDILDREFTDIVYGTNTPYGWQEEYATIDRVTRGDMQDFYRRYFFPANTMLAVRGDFNSAEMKAKLEKVFSDWTVQQPPVPPFPKVAGVPAAGVFLAAKPDVTQTFFALGHLGGEFRDADYPALEIMGDILGGGFHSRLFQRVRTQMGNAYEIGADWGGNYDHPGLFEISGSTKSVSTVETLKAILGEVDRIRASEVSEEELRTAKDTALNSLVFAFDSKAKTLGRLLTYEYFDYPRDFIQRYQNALAAVTRADVLRVAKEHLDPARFTIVAVGNPEHFQQPLEALGRPVKTIDLAIPEAMREAPKATPEGVARAKQLLVRAQQAMGGADVLAGVKDYTASIGYRLEADAGGGPLKEIDEWISPSSMRQDLIQPTGHMAVYCDGKIGLVMVPNRIAPLLGPSLEQIKGDIFRVLVRLVLSDRIENHTINALDDTTVEIAQGNAYARLVFDPATGLPRSLQYDSFHGAGPPKPTEEIYSDFHDVSGVKLPFHVVLMEAGKKFAEGTVADFKINTGLKPEDLERHL